MKFNGLGFPVLGAVDHGSIPWRCCTSHERPPCIQTFPSFWVSRLWAASPSMFLILSSFFLTFPTVDPLFIPFHHLCRRPHSQLCFPETPPIIFSRFLKLTGPLPSSSFLRRSDNGRPRGRRRQTGSPRTNLARWIGAVWRWQGAILCHCYCVHSRTNMHCTPTYANAQPAQALAQMLSCMIAHCDVGFGVTEAFRELAHTGMLHSVWFTMCACVWKNVCVCAFFLLFFLMWFKCISQIDFSLLMEA